MPPISEPARARSSHLGLTGLPDRDNPLAWKRKTLEGKRGARDLLTTLTDEEVTRYMSVAQDQVRLEERLALVKVLSAIGAIVLGVLVAWHVVTSGLARLDVAGLGLAAVMGYWPWRVFKCRQLWLKHLEAARAELARRQVAV
jgi:hypothetical protein